MIDCHAHLADDQFNQDVEEVIDRAKKSGVNAVIVVSEHKEQFSRIIDLATSYKHFCFPAFGIHPIQQYEGTERSVKAEDLDGLCAYVTDHHDRLACIGEIGLDFTPRLCSSESDKDQQKMVFLNQINIAKEYNLPINVHSRSAGRPTITALKEAGADKVLLHAFDGKPSVAMTGVQCGYYFSIPPSIIRSEQKQKLVRSIPLDNLLLESDSPALGPERMKRNEPCNLLVSCQYIATIKNIDVQTVARITAENAVKLFPKLSCTLTSEIVP